MTQHDKIRQTITLKQASMTELMNELNYRSQCDLERKCHHCGNPEHFEGQNYKHACLDSVAATERCQALIRAGLTSVPLPIHNSDWETTILPHPPWKNIKTKPLDVKYAEGKATEALKELEEALIANAKTNKCIVIPQGVPVMQSIPAVLGSKEKEQFPMLYAQTPAPKVEDDQIPLWDVPITTDRIVFDANAIPAAIMRYSELPRLFDDVPYNSSIDNPMIVNEYGNPEKESLKDSWKKADEIILDVAKKSVEKLTIDVPIVVDVKNA